MHYYHVRYNVYEATGGPVENEKWVQFNTPHNDFQVRQHFENEHNHTVSIITSKVINQEEFENRYNKIF